MRKKNIRVIYWDRFGRKHSQAFWNGPVWWTLKLARRYQEFWDDEGARRGLKLT